MIPETQEMIIKSKYVVAHTPNLDLKWASEGRREARNRARDAGGDAPVQLPGADWQDDLLFNKMSQVRSKHQKLPTKEEVL
jgi:hypothetical protein